MGKSDINNLGQYFTIDKVARFMNSFIEREVISGGSILDPCIGKNIFFQELKNNNFKLTGLEIDENLINQDIRNFYKQFDRKLIIGNYITHEFPNKFDAVVLNPPYTRQEKISDETKKHLTKITTELGLKISKRANLYIYFVLKSLSLLKNGGLLVAITYDSWLYSSFGEPFRKYITDNYELQQIVHFKNHAFVGVDVGATIIIIKNKKNGKDFSYVSLQNPDELDKAKNEGSYTKLSYLDLGRFDDHVIKQEKIVFNPEHFKRLADYSEKTPWRGAESSINKYFLFKTNKISGLSQIIKYSSTRSYFVDSQNTIFALSAPEHVLNIEVKEYLANIKMKILNDQDLVALKKRVLTNPYWYKFQLRNGGNVIFNYYFRDNIKFFFNFKCLPTMGNFYNLEINNNIFPTFALLNSALTRHTIKRFSKNQGRGLKKIQLNQFNEIPVIRLDLFTTKEIEQLQTLGQQLSQAQENIDQIIDNINRIVLLKYSKVAKQDINILNKIIVDTE